MANWQGVRALLGGPVIYMVFVGFLAIVVMLAAVFRRLDLLFFHASRAADRLQKNIGIPLIWGTTALILVAIMGIKLLQIPHARLIGILVLLFALALAGIGGAVSALALGRSITLSSKAASDDDLTAVRLGLSIFFAAEFVPIAGWILVFLAGCAGSAAFMESIFQDKNAPPGATPVS